MDEIRKLWIVLIIATPFWVLGFWGQRIENADRAPGYSVEARGWWAWLMGIRPGRGERVYLGSALLQVWALLYLAVGFLAIWVWDIKTLGSITAVFILVGLPLIGLAASLIIRFRNRQR